MLVKANKLCFGFILYLTSQQGFHLVKFQYYCQVEMLERWKVQATFDLFFSDVVYHFAEFYCHIVINIFQNEL